jgi:hypothetical protein
MPSSFFYKMFIKFHLLSTHPEKETRYFQYGPFLSTIETKEPARIGYNGFLFPDEYSGSTKAVTRVRMRKKKPVLSNTGKFICFNNNVSNLYNNSVVEKIYGMAYMFTLLMFRKSNKTINNNKTTKYRSTFFRFSFIFRYFKVFQVKRIVYI